MQFVFPKSAKKFAKSLSAIVPVGGDLWLGGDEGTELACMRPTPADAGKFEPVLMLDVVDELDLPDKAKDEEGRRSEADIEGADWDGTSGYLWLLGSHSLKRTAAEFEDDDVKLSDAENLARLATVSADGNRFMLGRIPLQLKDGKSEPVRRGGYTSDRFGARLDCSKVSSELLDALRTDTLFGRFLLPGHELPGKDNGLDFEGLAFVGAPGRLLVGMRGPVLRGMAVVLEIAVEEEFCGADQPGVLRLSRNGPGGQRYRRHFLALDGLSVRDLCFDRDDLLILAGPALAVDWPATIYRWKDARKAIANGTGDSFVWQESGALELIEGLNVAPPGGRGFDRAEGLARLGDGRFVIAFDSPSDQRFEKPATVRADEVAIPELGH